MMRARHTLSIDRRRGVWLALLLATAGLMASAVAATTSRLDGVDRKKLYGGVIANYLMGFGVNLTWPEKALAADQPWRVGVLGSDPFGDAIDQLVAGKKLGGRMIVIVREREPEKLADCQIVFADQPAQELLDRLAAAVAKRPVLTVVFSADQTAKGGAIELHLLKDGTVRFTLNAAALREAGLKPSPELLQFALRAPPR